MYSNHPVPGSSFEFCLGKTYFLWVKRILPMISISEYSWIWICGVPPLRPRLIACCCSPCIQIWLETTAFVKPTSIKSFPFHKQSALSTLYVDMVICISQTYLFLWCQIQNRIKRCGKASKINIYQCTAQYKKHRIQMIWTEKADEKTNFEISSNQKWFQYGNRQRIFDQWKRVKSKFYSFLLDHTNSEQMLLDFILISVLSSSGSRPCPGQL